MAQVQLDTALAAAPGILSAADPIAARPEPLGLSTKSAIVTAPEQPIDTSVEGLFGSRQPSVAATTVQPPLSPRGEEPAFTSSEAEAFVQTTAASREVRPSSIRALMKEIAALGRIFNLFSASYRDLYINSLETYSKLAKNQVSGMNAMAMVTLVSSVVGGAAGMSASFVPGLIPTGGIPNMPFLTADFVQNVLKHSGDIIPRVGDGVKAILHGPVVAAESQRALVDKAEINVEQQMMDQLTATLREVRQIVESIMQAKARQDG